MWGANSVFAATMSSGGTLTAEVDLGRVFENVYMLVPSGTTNSAYFIKVARTASASGGTYHRCTHPPLNSSTVTTNDFVIASGATGRVIPIPNGIRYMKIESEIAIADGATYRIFGGS